MGLFTRYEHYDRESVGTIVFTFTRIPFRFFVKKPARIFFRPALAGADFSEIDPEKVAVEELLTVKDPLSAMAIIRRQN